MTWYNENDKKTAAWLRRLIDSGKLPSGVVEDASIADVAEAPQGTAHFFAGIGGWQLACDMAGWPNDVEIWTGSCPCQPFSIAGRGKGTADERHLWPEWLRLIKIGMPAVIVGEQTASPAGRDWLASVFSDLEALGYACAGADLCTAGVGASHLRQRLYWMAIASGDRLERCRVQLRERRSRETMSAADGGGAACDMDYSESLRRRTGRESASGSSSRPQESCGPGATCDVGDTCSNGLQGSMRRGEQRQDAAAARSDGTSAWSDAEWVPCRDGVFRPAQPGVCPLAHGIPRRMELLKGYGNAIVPQLAAVFLQSVMDIILSGELTGDM